MMFQNIIVIITNFVLFFFVSPFWFFSSMIPRLIGLIKKLILSFFKKRKKKMDAIWDDFLEKKKLNNKKKLCENTFSVCSKYVFLKTMILSFSFVGSVICTNDFLCNRLWIGIWTKREKTYTKLLKINSNDKYHH